MADFLRATYFYFTDFCINMANLLDMSYMEFNFWLFLVAIPGFILILILLNLYRYILKPFFLTRT